MLVFSSETEEACKEVIIEEAGRIDPSTQDMSSGIEHAISTDREE